MTIRPDISLTETAEGGFLLDRITGDCFALNRLGLYVWHHLAEGRSPVEILDGVASAFDEVPRDTLSRDIETFIAALEQRSLLTA
jgi:hypothetical protein